MSWTGSDIKGKGKGAGFKSWSQAGSHDFTILPRWSLEMAPLLHNYWALQVAILARHKGYISSQLPINAG